MRIRLPALPALVAAACAWLAAACPAVAGVLQITVTGTNGRPAADTVVLVRRAASFQPLDLSKPVVITQKDIRFSPYVTVVPRGGTVRFLNEDGYAHHVRSMPTGPLGSVAPAANFEFRLAAARGGNRPGADVVLDTAGAIALGCHLHGSMRAHILVANTPWFAVTDAEGKATIDLPEGAGELQLWHPDQITEQASRPVQVGSGTLALPLQLNFNPPRRRVEASRDEYRY